MGIVCGSHIGSSARLFKARPTRVDGIPTRRLAVASVVLLTADVDRKKKKKHASLGGKREKIYCFKLALHREG